MTWQKNTCSLLLSESLINEEIVLYFITVDFSP